MNKKRQELIKKISDLISDGEIISEGKLPTERELAAMLGTSRPLLREALIALEALGLIDIRDRQGIFLAEDDSGDLRKPLGQVHIWPMEILSQVMEIRQLLDPSAIPRRQPSPHSAGRTVTWQKWMSAFPCSRRSIWIRTLSKHPWGLTGIPLFTPLSSRPQETRCLREFTKAFLKCPKKGSLQ